MLVTLRAAEDVTWLRKTTAFHAVTNALSRASRSDFRVVHFSVQTNHVHLIVEADGVDTLTRGMRGLGIRCALAVNRGYRTPIVAPPGRRPTVPAQTWLLRVGWRRHGPIGMNEKPASV